MRKIKNDYSVIAKIHLVVHLFRSKLISNKVRLIRFPIDIRGIKNIDFGVNLTTGRNCRFEAFGLYREKNIIFGENIQVNDFVHISAMSKVIIGNNTLLASHIYISDNSHGFYDDSDNSTSPLIPPIERRYKIAPVIIGENVWIGEGVVILPGVVIGDGVIIGANSVVNKSVEKYTIVVGQPARPIKEFNFKSQKWVKI